MSFINSGYGNYGGTENDLKRSFELRHKQLPIFERVIAGNTTSIVDINNNLIKIPNHFFVTGEELTYSYGVNGEPIGIATTNIIGIGTTNKLPSTVYAIKIDNISIRLSDTIENALKTIPIPLTLNSVGVGVSHKFTSKKQNTKVLITIDNVIQSPVVSTAITTTLINDVSIPDNTIKVSGITSFFGADLIQVNDEIMRINSVGFGSTNVFLVSRPWLGTGISTHSSGSVITKVFGDYNIIDNTIHFSTAPYGKIGIGTTTGNPNDVDYEGLTSSSSFSGRTFMRSANSNGSEEPYEKNYIFDDISSEFSGFTTSFTLTSNGSNITGISTSNSVILINEIFQGPQRNSFPVSVLGDYELKESVGITSIQFTGNISSTSYYVNTAIIPVGGIIVSVGSTQGFGFQPLVSAGGTAVISGLGTISSISIGNSGSGYRSGIQTVNVGVATSSVYNSEITYIGTASIQDGHIVGISITNPGTGYTSTNPPLVIFDSPLSYSNLPLIYSSSSSLGVGTQAKINVVVGQGSSVIDFEIKNFGYGYKKGEILTVAIGGTVGIPTNTSLSYNEFQITIEETYSNKFSGWSIGDLLVIDSIDSLFDGKTVSFPIFVNGEQKSIRAKSGSLIDNDATLLIFINDILQVPKEGYIFNGGSYITFTEPPKPGDKSKILFYQGTSDIDIVTVDILESIKLGDKVQLNDDDMAYSQNERIVTEVRSSDNLNTNLYFGPGISLNENYTRPVKWCRQTEDLFIDGKSVGKNRNIYEPLIYPYTRIIKTVGTSSTEIFVESVKTFFDNQKENTNLGNKIKIISQESLIGASATAIVSVGGTISSISIVNGGKGYKNPPLVTISNPIGYGTTQRATATSFITSGIVTSIVINSSGIGYTSIPEVLIEEPKYSDYIEEISPISYTGDFGIISGVSTTSVGVASTGIVFDLVIPKNSFLRDSSIVGTAITISGIQTNYYFVVFNSNIGNGVTSLSLTNSIVGIGSTFLDNIYQVSSVSIAQTSVTGMGLTYVARVVVSVQNYNNLTGLGYSSYYGEYSWGRISAPERDNSKEFIAYNNGLSGISTSPIVERYSPLKYINYIS